MDGGFMSSFREKVREKLPDPETNRKISDCLRSYIRKFFTSSEFHMLRDEVLGIAEFPIIGCIRKSRVRVKDTAFSSRVVGVAAFTGVPRCIYSDNIAADVFDSVFAAEYPDDSIRTNGCSNL